MMEQNININEEDDNDFSSNTHGNMNSKPFFGQNNKAPFIGRTFTSSEKKPNLNFLKGSNSIKEPQQNPQTQDINNTKPNYLEKIRNLNSMNNAQTTTNLLRNSSSYQKNQEQQPYGTSYIKKEETVQNNEDIVNSNSTMMSNANEYNPMKRPDSSGGMIRPQSSQSSMVRQQFLEQQKQKLKDKQMSLISNKSITINKTNSINFNNPSFFNELKKQEDFDYKTLEKVVKQDNREQYEPGGTNSKNFGLAGLTKVDHTISFKPQNNQPEEKLEEYNLEDNPTTRKEDVNLIHKQDKKATIVMKEIIKEETPVMADEEQQRSSHLKETSPAYKPKNKAVKFNDEDDLDDETIKIAKQIKALKEGKQQGEIKISLKGDGKPVKIEKPVEKTSTEHHKKKALPLSEEKQNDNNNQDSEENENDEEEKVEPQIKHKASVVEKPTSIKIFTNFESISNMKEFLTNPAPKNCILQCVIRRERSGWGRIYPKYKVFFSNKGTFMLSGKKRSHNKTSNYLISLSPDDFKKNSENIVGKVRSNFMGTEFHVYDTGHNPKKAMSFETVRKELGVVTYETNFFGAKGPRKMKALVPDLKEDGDGFYQWKPTKNDDGMLNYFKSGKREGVKHLFNKPPKWNEHIGAFVLNFNGRVDKPSVKNFQLIDEYDDNIIYLQFGRTGNEEFTMDYMYPLTAVQAFGICLSSFDYKIACE